MPRLTSNSRLVAEAFGPWFSKALQLVFKLKSSLILQIHWKCLLKAKHMLKLSFAWHSLRHSRELGP